MKAVRLDVKGQNKQGHLIPTNWLPLLKAWERDDLLFTLRTFLSHSFRHFCVN